MSEITRTVKLKVDLPWDAALRTVDTWTEACSRVSRIAFSNGGVSNAVKLQKLAYAEAKSAGLSAQVAVSCIRHVASKYASARKNKHRIKAPFAFRRQAVILQGGKRGRDVSLRSMRFSGLSIWTVDGRKKAVPFQGPPGLEDKFANWELGDGRLFVDTKTRKVYLTLSFRKSVEEKTAPNDAVIGVDRGINVIACATDGRQARFLKGGHTKHVRDRYLKVRASLQRKKAERKTRAIGKLLKRLSGREKRFMTAVNHEVSKAVVTFANKAGCPVIAVERLNGIRKGRLRKKTRTEVHRWAYGQLRDFLVYKAASEGMSVIEIDPKGTSKGCSKCGYTDPANRKGLAFKCLACGYSLHADLNASRNIRLRGILARQVPCQDGLLSWSPEVRSVDPGWKPGEDTDKPSASADGT